MDFEREYAIAAPRETLWDMLMDVERVTACIDGVQDLEVVDDDNFQGVLGVKMGPVKLKFGGTVSVTSRDRDNWRAALRILANDRKAGGGFVSDLAMELVPDGEVCTLVIKLTTSLSGRMGQMGRPLIQKRVASMLDDFAQAVAVQVGA